MTASKIENFCRRVLQNSKNQFYTSQLYTILLDSIIIEPILWTKTWTKKSLYCTCITLYTHNYKYAYIFTICDLTREKV
jgi:hypothetical protein